jgi:UPF0042 nucleotide-binding protein
MLEVMHLVLISGLSGSGKSIALKVLEDANYYCVDNLPSQLLQPLVGQLDLQGYDKVGVVIDIRGGDSVAMLPLQLDALRANELDLQFLFLDAQDATLIKRYSETRRRHPLASDQLTLTEAIAEERIRLGELAALGHHIDTSGVKASALRDLGPSVRDPGSPVDPSPRTDAAVRVLRVQERHSARRRPGLRRPLSAQSALRSQCCARSPVVTRR